MTNTGKLRSRGSHHIPALVCGVLFSLLVAGCEATESNKPENKLPPKQPEETAVGNLLKTLDNTLVKVEGREDTFAKAGNTRGAQLMNKAAGNVKAMQVAARSLRAGATAASASASSEETTAAPAQREAFGQILENRRHLTENIREAKRCCGLPPGFMDEDLRELDADIETLRTKLGLNHSEETTGSTFEQYRSGSATGGALEQTR